MARADVGEAGRHEEGLLELRMEPVWRSVSRERPSAQWHGTVAARRERVDRPTLSVMLCLDCTNPLGPDFAAARYAARTFVEGLRDDDRVGLVLYGAYGARLAVKPTELGGSGREEIEGGLWTAGRNVRATGELPDVAAAIERVVQGQRSSTRHERRVALFMVNHYFDVGGPREQDALVRSLDRIDAGVVGYGPFWSPDGARWACGHEPQPLVSTTEGPLAIARALGLEQLVVAENVRLEIRPTNGARIAVGGQLEGRFDTLGGCTLTHRFLIDATKRSFALHLESPGLRGRHEVAEVELRYIDRLTRREVCEAHTLAVDFDARDELEEGARKTYDRWRTAMENAIPPTPLLRGVTVAPETVVASVGARPAIAEMFAVPAERDWRWLLRRDHTHESALLSEPSPVVIDPRKGCEIVVQHDARARTWATIEVACGRLYLCPRTGYEITLNGRPTATKAELFQGDRLGFADEILKVDRLPVLRRE